MSETGRNALPKIGIRNLTYIEISGKLGTFVVRHDGGEPYDENSLPISRDWLSFLVLFCVTGMQEGLLVERRSFQFRGAFGREGTYTCIPTLRLVFSAWKPPRLFHDGRGGVEAVLPQPLEVKAPALAGYPRRLMTAELPLDGGSIMPPAALSMIESGCFLGFKLQRKCN